VLANPSRKVQAQLSRVHLLQDIGQQWVFLRTADAVAVCLAAIRERESKLQLPADDIATPALHIAANGGLVVTTVRGDKGAEKGASSNSAPSPLYTDEARP
jgi:hypothetical protein